MKLFRAKNFFKKKPNKSFIKIGLFLFIWVAVMIGLVHDTSAASEGGVNMKTRIDEYASENNLEGEGSSEESFNEKTAGTLNPFKLLLLGTQEALHQLTLAAAKMFDFALWESSGVVDIEEGYKAWTFVRDLLNLFFMLVLLFSAFATIFQVEKYHLKKMIVLLIVMALLVNFSYPITLFVIDFSNSLMYFLANYLSTGESAKSKSVAIAKIVDMGGMLNMYQKHTIVNLILLNIFEFLLFITIFAFAINLIVRMLAFIILIIFSPVGFVFSFFPGTKSIADSWWSNLFKYAALGPIMIFFLILAYLMFDMSAAASSGGAKSSLIKSMISFGISITFLWMGLIASNKFGAVASNAAMSVAKNTGNKIKGYAQKGAWGATKFAGRTTADATGVSGAAAGVKMGLNRLGSNISSRTNSMNSRIAGGVAGSLGVSGAESELVEKEMASLKDKKTSEAKLHSLASSGNTAAVRLLANDDKINQATYDAYIEKTKASSEMKDKVSGKVRKTKVHIVANNKIRQAEKAATASGGAPLNLAQKTSIAEKEMNELNSEDWKKQDLEAMSSSRGTHIQNAASTAFTDLDGKAQEQVKASASGKNHAAGGRMRMW